jgi:hypothetical protein
LASEDFDRENGAEVGEASASSAFLTDALRRLEVKLPKPLKLRLRNTLEHFDRSARLVDIDLEMASFRAITGEEEAATTLMRAVQLRRYPDAEKFIPYRHQHKAGVIACVMALRNSLLPILAEFQLVFNFEKGRIDIKVPLSTFGVKGGENYAIQPEEPLGFTHTREGVEENRLFDDALQRLAAASNYPTIRKLVEAQANARNNLLYASDSAMPASRATLETLANRESRALAMLVLAVMVYQARKPLPLVRQVIPAFLKIISRIQERSDGA